MMVIATLLIVFNYLLVSTVHGQKMKQMKLSGDLAQDAVALVISEGVPEIYGMEMGVDFSQVQDSIYRMQVYDPGYGSQKIILTGDKLQRYIDVTTRISCEFCCGAAAIGFGDGTPACGCAHSQAMRGLVAYLIEYHGEQYTNDEVLRELSRWKGLYFPKQMIKKLADQIQSGQYTPDIASLLIGVDVSKISNTSAPLPSDIKDLPSMVGGC